MAIALNANNARAYNNRGIVKYNLGDLDGAILDWRKARELGSTEADENIKQYLK